MSGLWMPFPRETYIASAGICPADLKLDILKRLPGAWNMLVLHADPEDEPEVSNIIGACVGSTFQVVPDTNGMTVGELAVSLSSSEFVDRVRGWREFLPRLELMLLNWQNIMAERVPILEGRAGLKRIENPKSSSKVIAINFGR